MIIKIFFWIFILVDLATVGLIFLLGLAAAGPSHTSPLAVTGLLLILPAVLILAAIALFLLAKSPLWRGAAFCIAAAPLLLTVASVAIGAIDAARYRDADGNFTAFTAGPMRELEAAIAKNDAPAVAQIAAKANLKQTGRDGSTILVYALRHGANPQILQSLLQAGADPNARQLELPLSVAIQISRSAGPEPVRLLLQAGANPNALTDFGTPVFFAGTGAGVDPQVLPILLDNGANLSAKAKDGRNVLGDAVPTRNWKAILLLLQRGADWKSARTPMGLDFRAAVEADAGTFPNSPDRDAVLQFLKN